LTELGYVEQSGREFRPMPRLRGLGGVTTGRDRIARLAEPLLKRARDRLAESVSLAVLDDDRPHFIARAEAEHILSTGVRVGAYLPAYCSATGRVLLGQFPDSEIARRIGRKPLPARTPHTITRLTPLLAEIQATRKRGYGVSDEELELGMRAMAVPVIGDGDEIIAAISVSAASARVRTADLRNHFLPVLQSCARMLSEALRNRG
jgi:IclR family pca regulon transcriptional regulator